LRCSANISRARPKHWRTDIGWAWGLGSVLRSPLRKRVSRDPIIHGVSQTTVLLLFGGRNRTNPPSSRSNSHSDCVHRDLDGELGPRGGGGHPLLSLPGRHLPRRRGISGTRTNTSHAHALDVILPSNRPTPTVWHPHSAQALGWLLSVPGASGTVLEVVVPYSRASMAQLLGKVTKSALPVPEHSAALRFHLQIHGRTSNFRTDPALMVRCPCNSLASRLQRTWHWPHTIEHSSFLDQVFGSYICHALAIH
jgi:hypothetical protein